MKAPRAIASFQRAPRQCAAFKSLSGRRRRSPRGQQCAAASLTCSRRLVAAGAGAESRNANAFSAWPRSQALARGASHPQAFSASQRTPRVARSSPPVHFARFANDPRVPNSPRARRAMRASPPAPRFPQLAGDMRREALSADPRVFSAIAANPAAFAGSPARPAAHPRPCAVGRNAAAFDNLRPTRSIDRCGQGAAGVRRHSMAARRQRGQAQSRSCRLHGHPGVGVGDDGNPRRSPRSAVSRGDASSPEIRRPLRRSRDPIWPR